MQEGFINELFKIFISIIMVCMLAMMTMYFISISNLKEYKHYVGLEIERNGGLTNEALENISNINEKYYKGQFSVEKDGNMSNDPQPYGTLVDYTVRGDVSFKLFFEVDQTIEMNGTAASMIRTREW